MDSLTFIGGPYDGDHSANDLMNFGAIVVMPGGAIYHIDRDGAAKYSVTMSKPTRVHIVDVASVIDSPKAFASAMEKAFGVDTPDVEIVSENGAQEPV